MRFGRTLRHLTAAGVAASLALGLGATAQAQDYNIKIAFMGSIEDEDYDGSLVFKDFVESHSNGKIGVEIFPAAQLCGNFREPVEHDDFMPFGPLFLLAGLLVFPRLVGRDRKVGNG